MSSDHSAKETTLAEPLRSSLARLTEFFSADHIEAAARRTGFVQRAAKITGKVLLGLITFGPGSTAKTSWAQVAAKAGQLSKPVAVSPEASYPRLNARALAFLREMSQRAFAKLHAGDTVGEEGLLTPFTRVHLADSPGFGRPESLQALCPRAGGRAGQAGAKLQLVWDSKRSTFAPFALIPWNIPDNKYLDPVVALAQKGALFLLELGSLKLAACACMAAAQAYFLTRLNHQTPLSAAVGGGLSVVERPRVLPAEPRPLLEKAVFLGAREHGAARLIAVRLPEAIGNERRRQARNTAKKRGSPPSHAHLTRLAWHLLVTHVPGTVWAPQTVGKAYPIRWQVELIFKSGKSYLQLATLPTKTATPTLCYLYGRWLLSLRNDALCPALRAALGAQKRRELRVLKRGRHFQAVADPWFQLLFQAPLALRRFLHQVCATAQRLVAKASRKRRTSAQLLRESLHTQNHFIEFTAALAA